MRPGYSCGPYRLQICNQHLYFLVPLLVVLGEEASLAAAMPPYNTVSIPRFRHYIEGMSTPWKRWNRLFSYVRPYRMKLALAAVLLIAAGLLALGLPFYTGQLIDSLTVDPPPMPFKEAVLAMLGVMAGQGILTFAGGLLVAWVDEKVLASVRGQAFGHLLRLPMRFFLDRRRGELVSRLGYDVELIGSATTQNMIHVLQSVLTLIAVIVVMALISTKLTVVSLIGVPLFAIVAVLFSRKTFRLSDRHHTALADLSSSVDECVANMHLIKSYARESREEERFQDGISRAFRTGMRYNVLTALYRPAAGIIAFGATLVVLWSGHDLVEAGLIRPGELLAYLLYLGMMVASLSSLAGSGMHLAEAMGALNNLFGILDTAAEQDGSKSLVLEGRIEIKDLGFGYRTRRPIFDKFSAAIEPGDCVALLGPSGVGKTTLLNLIAGFLQPDSGYIKIDGIDMDELILESLRSQLGFVTQEAHLISGTIRDNILIGNEQADDAAIARATDTAGIRDFIESLPDKYDTPVGEDGVKLSQGQRQRICLARAIVKNPPVLLLDEPTSSLDSESELAIVSALQDFIRGRTTILVAHQPALLGLANRKIKLNV